MHKSKRRKKSRFEKPLPIVGEVFPEPHKPIIPKKKIKLSPAELQHLRDRFQSFHPEWSQGQIETAILQFLKSKRQ